MLMRTILHCGAAMSCTTWIELLFCLAMLPTVALADAGAVRVSQRLGNRQITVFTDPTPLRAGPIDVSVLVQDAATGEAVLEDSIDVDVTPRGLSSAIARFRATSGAASNKLFQAANFELRAMGWLEFTVSVQGPKGNAKIRFEALAGEPLPPWQMLWPWFCWPFSVIGFFVVLQLLRPSARPASRESLAAPVARKWRSTARGSPSPSMTRLEN
jgi:hypothetical protein